METIIFKENQERMPTSKVTKNNALTVLRLAEIYCRDAVLSQPSRRMYFNVARVFQNDTGVSCIEDVSREMIVEWRTELITRASIQTWNTYRLHLKVLFSYAVELELLSKNYFKDVKSIRSQKRKKVVKKSLVRMAIDLLNLMNPR